MSRKLNGIFKASDKVKEYLTDPVKGHLYRDNDEKLLTRYWADEFLQFINTTNEKKEVILKHKTAFEFLTALGQGKLTSPEEIIRARRKCQQHFPETRGEKWNHRHQEEEDVRQGINS